MKLITAALVALLAGAGCAGPDIFGGAPSVAQITSDTIQVSARGNGWSDIGDVERMILRKAAEETVRLGYDHFYAVGANDSSKRGAMLLSGGMIAGTNKPGAVITYRMVKGEVDPALNAYSAQEVLAHVGP
jgi:hypothetical protein